MSGLSGSEWMLYGGIAVMVLAVIMAIVNIMVFLVKRNKLKEQLEKEYGKLELK